MTARPIIFSAAMVRALLDGRKTQTRRLATSPLRRCEVGDRLWVRENFYQFGGPIEYAADDGAPSFARKLTPSIHMPRWASRLTLIVEAVRVEPVQAISEEDAIAEGIEYYPDGTPQTGSAYGVRFSEHGTAAGATGREAYSVLWDLLHDKPGQRWDANPAVVALTFRVERGNIDRLTEQETPHAG